MAARGFVALGGDPKGSVVAAGAVVARSVSAATIISGVLAKKIGGRLASEGVRPRWAWRYLCSGVLCGDRLY